jgi:hypothetical protein
METVHSKETSDGKQSLTVEQTAAFVHAALSSREVEKETMENIKHLVTVNCNREANSLES